MGMAMWVGCRCAEAVEKLSISSQVDLLRRLSATSSVHLACLMYGRGDNSGDDETPARA